MAPLLEETPITQEELGEWGKESLQVQRTLRKHGHRLLAESRDEGTHLPFSSASRHVPLSTTLHLLCPYLRPTFPHQISKVFSSARALEPNCWGASPMPLFYVLPSGEMAAPEPGKCHMPIIRTKGGFGILFLQVLRLDMIGVP